MIDYHFYVQGVGKTVQMLALIIAERSPVDMPTLVVCPASVRNNWVAEITKYYTAAAEVKVLSYYKPNRRKDPRFIASHDIVITSYEIAAMEGPIFRRPGMKAKKGDDCVKALAKVNWFRIILDECQKIKTWNNKGAIACMSYSAPRRWCLSGTPVQNKSMELLSYYRFLRYKPFCSTKFFMKLIKQTEKGNADAGKVLTQSFAAISLRRTKGD